ncbi:hypothetical protein F511_19602 [Dorcoceras hygrometricum]|uniref:Splicing factor 3B subunit 1-like n=1 Tax=Dorcoceras hygrometricum TaxID=472368 RepID=A0A2Z7C0G1_9LAMI|nr:hypothetical protein F511_19602 [Dorcoceras hygrometricum]
MKKAASKKRPATDAVAETVVKKKRTTKSKSVSAKETLEILPVAQEVVPLQMIAPTTAAPAEQTPVPKRKTQKRKRRLILSHDDEIVDSETATAEPAVGGSVEEESILGGIVFEQGPAAKSVEERENEPVVESTAEVLRTTSADDVDFIIQQVVTETAQLETAEGEQVDEPDVNRATVEDNDTNEEFIADQVFGIGVEKMETVAVEQSVDEAMSLEDILMTIPAECPLPSAYAYVEITKIILGETISIPGVNEGDWYKASLPMIPAADKGKAPLLERDPVKGNPIKEQFSLILADIEVLVMFREKIIDDVDRFFNSFSLKRLATLKIDESYFDKEALILSWAETDSTRVALNRRTYILTKYRELLIRKFLEARKINFTPCEGSSATDLKTMAHGLKWEKTCRSKLFEGRPRDPGAIIARTNTSTRSTCWIRTMIRVHGVWVIEPCGDHWVKIPREVVNNEISRQRSYEDTLPPKLSAQIAAAAFDTVDVRKEVKEINAKVNYLDGQVAEIRSEQLDFRAKTEENYLNLSTQLGLIIDYLRSGDAKKGECGSSRPQPPHDDQSRPSGGSGGSGTRERGSRGGNQRRGDRSESSKRRYSSSGGGPFRRSFEDWLG